MLSILYSKSPHHKSLALLFLLLTVSGVLLGSSVTRAGLAHDVGGWAWGGTQDTVTPTATGLGWVSMNSTDCDTNGDGIILGGEIGVNGCTAGGITNYGITIPAVVGGTLSGYAWSENYGWLSFSAADLASCPTGLCSARRTATGIEGWARILSLRVSAADGGWVKLAADASDTVSYEVTYDASGQTFGGYAYSDEIGWLDFAPVVIAPPPASISILPCTVSDESNTCTGQLTAWDLSSAAVPSIARLLPAPVIELTNLPVGVIPIAIPFVHGVNEVAGRDGGVVIESTRTPLNIACSSSSFYHTNPGIEVCKAKPIITATPATIFVRANQMAKIRFNLAANYQVQCTAVGGVPAGSTINHSGVPTLQSHEFTTNPLPSTQVVEIACEVPGIPASREEVRVRINVLPIQQET